MDTIEGTQKAFIDAVINGEDPATMIETLIMADCDLSKKYMVISMDNLIDLNGQNVDHLHRITIALSILEKYARHLLKPEENRSNMWKYVKYSNQIFKDRVDSIVGGRDLMKMMGYTKDIKDGLSFPDDGRTNPEQLTRMLADILLGKQELNLYLTGSHPHAYYIDKLLPQNTLKELKRFQDKLLQIDPTSVRSATDSQTPEQPAQNIRESVAQPVRDESHIQPGGQSTMSSYQSSQVYRTAMESSSQPPSQYGYITAETGQSDTPNNFVTPETHYTAAVSQANVNLPLHNAQPSIGQIDSSQIPLMAKLVAQGKSIRSISSVDIEPSHSSVITTVCQPATVEESTNIVPSETSQQTQVPVVGPQISSLVNSDSIVQNSTEESVFPSASACDICGNRPAEIMCEVCDNKQLCRDCDDKWHQHPRRQNHQRRNMNGDIEEPHVMNQKSRSSSQGDPTGASSYEPKMPMGSSHIGGGEGYMTANFGTPQQQMMGQPGMGNLTNQMHQLGIEGFNRPRTYSSGESLAGASDMTHMVEPQSVQTGNWSNPHGQYQAYPQNNMMGPMYGGPVSHNIMTGSQQPMSHQPGASYMGQQSFPRNQQYQTNQSFMGQPKNMSSAAPGGPPTSRLLPAIMSIPDLSRRKAKLDINLMTLREEIEEVEVKINELISQNAQFFSDPDYATLYKKKGMLTREKIELEKYERELDQEEQLKTSYKDPLSQPVIYPPAYGSPSVVTPSAGYVVYHFPPATVTHGGSLSPETQTQHVYSIMPSPQVFQSPQYQHVLGAHGNRIPDQHGMVHSPIPSQGSRIQDQHGMIHSPVPSHANRIQDQHGRVHSPTPGQGNRIPDQRGMMHSPTQSQGNRIPDQQRMFSVQSPSAAQGRAINQQDLLPSPQLRSQIVNKQQASAVAQPPVRQAEKGQLTPQRRSFEGKVDNTPPQPITAQNQMMVQENMPLEERQNQQNTLKLTPPVPHRPTSGTPHSYVNVPNVATFSQSTPKAETQVTSSTEARTWICSHCTYHNTNATKICQICSKTSSQPKYIDEAKLDSPQPKNDVTDKPKPAESIDENETVVVEVRPYIAEVHDEIYREKKAAQRQYKEQLEKQKKEASALKPAVPKPKYPDPINISTPSPLKPDIATPKDINTKMINRPKDIPTKSPDSGDNKSGSTSSSSSKNFAENLEDIQRRRKQEEMQYEGKKLLALMKNCEKDGIDADEVEIAIEKSGETEVGKWLKEKWMPLVDRVIHMATNQGAQMEQNDVGEISVTESKEALRQSNCDLAKAVKLCVENRKKMYKEIQTYGNFAREEILQAMLHSEGDLDSAVDELNSKWLQLFHERIWPSNDNPHGDERVDRFQTPDAVGSGTSDICSSVTNSVLMHTSFQAVIKDKNVDVERRIRLILVEGKLQSWGRAEIVIRILDEEVDTGNIEASLEEVVMAVKNCGDRASSLVFLMQYCQICYSQFPMTKIRNIGCNCKICVHCVRENFEISIRERHVRNLNCPLCSQPDMEDVDASSDYLTFLTLLLQTLVSQDIMELYHSKLRDWHLQKDPNFRWCAHCGNGFIWAVGNETLKMVCPTCQQGTCFNCKKIWEDQHEGLTCEQFRQWKVDNDPENQTAGLARYLEDNGIDCPSCKMKFSLAKGGCMHFKCPQCGFEFCSGCSQPFYQKGVCRKFNSCRNKGLHCHHPRTCLYYLRDEDFGDLQRLLKNNKIQFNTTAPDQEASQTCPVMEQKEDPEGKRDEACGREVEEGFAGLCTIHYKEYLVSLINKRNVDPLAIMSVDAMKRLIEREEKRVPERKSGENDAKYRKKLEQFIREIEPLNRQQ